MLHRARTNKRTRTTRRRWVDDALVRRIERLAARRPNATLRALAEAAGASLSTVRRVLRGETGPAALGSPVAGESQNTIQRCGGCGAKVLQPCHLCGLRARQARIDAGGPSDA